MSNLLSEALHACRLCGSSNIDLVLDATSQPPANSLRKPSDPAPPCIPLVLCRCASCGTLQLSETVDPEYLFSHYVWVTGTSAAAHGYAREFANNILSRATEGSQKVLEVASNDGTFLRPFLSLGHAVVGVDPAANIAETANQAGILTYPSFFGAATSGTVVEKHGRFDVVFARNVLPHVKDPNDVVAGMVAALTPGGLLAIEFHRADTILAELHYDSIYHEHLFYHSLASIERLTGPHGLHVFDITLSPISGGSYVAYFSREPRAPSAALTEAQLRDPVHHPPGRPAQNGHRPRRRW
jgi:SAM-dependent methyltransferase